MKRKLNLLFLSFFCVLLAMAAPGELKEKLQQEPSNSGSYYAISDLTVRQFW